MDYNVCLGSWNMAVNNDFNFIGFLWTQILPMQFTWLQDKNHKDIYEGDILESTRPAKDRYLVVWDEGDAAFYAKDMHFGSLWKIPNNQNCVIIGNMYENTDLTDQ